MKKFIENDYPYQDDIWPSRRWSRDYTEYIDIGGNDEGAPYIAVVKASATRAQVMYFQTPEEAEKAGPIISFLKNTEENRRYCEEACLKFNARYNELSESKIR
jgi:hypothetical protein